MDPIDPNFDSLRSRIAWVENYLDSQGLRTVPPDLTWEQWNAGVQRCKQEREGCEKMWVQYQDAPTNYRKLVYLENYLKSVRKELDYRKNKCDWRWWPGYGGKQDDGHQKWIDHLEGLTVSLQDTATKLEQYLEDNGILRW